MNEVDFAKAIIDTMKRQIPRNQVFIASVTSPPPALKISFGGIEIPSEQIYCSNYLLPNYKRTYKLEGTIDEMKQEISKFDNTVSSSTMKPAGQGPHTHDILSTGGTSATAENTGTYKTHGDFWFTDTLTVGTEVLVMIVDKYYVVTDRLVKMPNSAIEGGA
ncbi:MAG: DUF2577 family protein [Fusobacteriaceae bacterium]